MKPNGKLFVALHALVHLAVHPGEAVPSEVLAACQATHPVVVRRTMGLLRSGGVVRSSKGPGGGWTLARDAREISLQDVYAALGEPVVDLLDPAAGSGGCAILRAVSDVVGPLHREIQALAEERLSRLTLTDLVDDVGRGYLAFHGDSQRSIPHVS